MGNNKQTNSLLTNEWPGVRPIRVLVAALDSELRAELCDLIDHTGRVQIVGQVGSAAQALILTTTLQPDLVLLDMAIRGANGLVVTRRLKSLRPTIPVVLLTSLEASEYLAVARSSGVDKCLTKRDVAHELLPLIESFAPTLH